MRFFKFTVVFIPEEDEPNTYNVSVPALPEAITFGTSFEDARFMAEDVLELVVLSKLERGEEIPKDRKPQKVPNNAKIEEIIVTVDHHVTATPARYVKTAIA